MSSIPGVFNFEPFGGDTGNPSVSSPQFVVCTAKINPPSPPSKAGAAWDEPTWDQFVEQPLLRVRGIEKGSSIGGMSQAKISLAPSLADGDPDARIETLAADVIDFGWRVVIGARDVLREDPLGLGIFAPDASIRWLFAGYCTQGHVEINANGETMNFTVMGPEWIWGTSAGGGSRFVVVGQVRRDQDADADLIAAIAAGSVTPVTEPDKLQRFDDERCVFNPHGRANMTTELVNFVHDSPSNQGRCFESPDRMFNSTPLAAKWDVYRATLMLMSWYNDPDATGIDMLDTFDPLPANRILDQVDVDGMGLWEAVKRVIGSEYFCAIDPAPTTGQWGGFKLKFYQRGVDASGGAASLYLNPLGTSAADSPGGIVRLEAVKDIGKTVNRAIVLGKAVRHIRLGYAGLATLTLSDADKNTSLQNGWTDDDGQITDYALGTPKIVSPATIDATSSTAMSDWRKKFCVDGAEFQKNKHIFRLFTWNEAAEWFTIPGHGKPGYGPGPSDTAEYWVPDLTGIADLVDIVEPDTTFEHKGVYCRRRRRILDTFYLESTGVDGWRKVKPTLFIAAVNPFADSPITDWVRVSDSHWKPDPERVAVWITHHDIATWYPFGEPPDPDDPKINDGRSFATLLCTGKLRMLLECSIECDWALPIIADRDDTSGTPFTREAVVRAPDNFIKSATFEGGPESPMGLSGITLDSTADAQTYANSLRDAAKDQNVHGSFLVSADWPESKILIGSIITQTDGRVIGLTGGPSGRGAQIVSLRMDVDTMCWEVLTETALLKLRDSDRMRAAHAHATRTRDAGRRLRGESRKPGALSSVGEEGGASDDNWIWGGKQS